MNTFFLKNECQFKLLDLNNQIQIYDGFTFKQVLQIKKYLFVLESIFSIYVKQSIIKDYIFLDYEICTNKRNNCTISPF